MGDVLIFPDTRSAVFDLIDGTEHLVMPSTGEVAVVRASYFQSADEYGSPITGGDVEVVITQDAGTQGFVDRVDRLSLDVYAPGERAMNALNSVLGLLVGTDVETPTGAYLDEISVDQTPNVNPYPSDILTHAMCRIMVTVRPV